MNGKKAALNLKMAKRLPCVLVKVMDLICPVDLSTSENTGDTYILEYDAKLFSLHSTKAEHTVSVFKTVHHFIAFWEGWGDVKHSTS